MHYKTEIFQTNLYAFAEIQNPKMMPKIQWCLCRHVSADAPTSLIFAFTEIQNSKKMHKIQCPLGVGSHLEYHFCHPLDTGVHREPLVPGGDLLCTPWNRPFWGCGGWGWLATWQALVLSAYTMFHQCHCVFIAPLFFEQVIFWKSPEIAHLMAKMMFVPIVTEEHQTF